MPCPSCGVTRSIIKIINSEYKSAFYLNPLGFVIFLGLIMIPVWVAIDFFCKKNSLFRFYYYFEKWIKKPYILIPLIILVLINWIWNIGKGL